ncbi:MAG: glycosyltransferase family 2 protein, partial [Pseudomonadota bacterium]
PAPSWAGDNIAGTLRIDGPVRLSGLAADRRPDPTLLEGLDPLTCLGRGFVPWRRIGRTTVIATDGRSEIEEILATLPERRTRIVFAPAPRAEIEAAIGQVFGDRLAARARSRTPAGHSCAALPWPRIAWLVVPVIGAALLFAPLAALAVLIAWISVINFATMAIRATALVESMRTRQVSAPVIPIGAAPKPPPRISLLIPLLREDVVLRHLIVALERLEYPKDRLDVKLVLEDDDVATPLALAQVERPEWIKILRAPRDALRTKPRALNFALDFCEGEIIGVYDAEDRPEPGQLRAIVRHFESAPADVACLQGQLDFYNARQNWLARCFTLEYAIWFRVLLKGIERLRLPLPLGGTTVFFRRAPLEAVGAWDAHNVTEDADLGMRLARFGFRTEMVATTTMEEANCLARPWIIQRSRWLKGYAMTWASHMRAPKKLWQDLGPAGFLGFQVLFLGGLTSYLATPLFWVLALAAFGLQSSIFDALPAPLWTGFFASMAIGQSLMLAVAVRAALPHPRRHLLPFVPTLLFYWPLGAVAAYRALWDLFRAPFHWHKTKHGI